MVRFFVVGIAAETFFRLENKVKECVNAPVEHFNRKLTSAHGVRNFFVVIASGGGHFKVVAGNDALNAVVCCAPVGNNNAVKAPFVAQNGLLKLLVIGAVDTVKLVISVHNGPRLAFFNGNFKSGEVNFAQGALVNNAVNRHTAHFLIVGCKMLEGGSDTL